MELSVVVLSVVGIVVAIAVRLATRLIVDEAVAWFPILTRRIASAAAGLVPSEHRARYSEEWLAEIEALADRKLAALAFAVRVFLGSWATRAELRVGTRESDLRPGPPPAPGVADLNLQAASAAASGSLELTAPAPAPTPIEATEPARGFITALLERTRPPSWEEIREDMGEPAEHDVEDEIQAGAQEFDELLKGSDPLP